MRFRVTIILLKFDLNLMNAFDHAAELLHLSPNTLKRLQTPDRVVFAQIPVARDSGELIFFDAMRVQHNNLRGPYKGGIRFHPKVDLEEVKHLAFWMTMKTSVMDLPLGGGKGGVVVDPKSLSDRELEGLSRGYVAAFFPVLGARKDVPAPDVYTTPRIMAWMSDEFSRLAGSPQPATFTGKPIEAGGSEGRDIATAQGGFYLLERLIQRKQCPLKPTIVIQGFGNAGSVFATLAHDAGMTVLGISDSKGGIIADSGLNISDVLKFKEEHGTVVGFPGTRTVSQMELLTSACDVLVPAALSDQIAPEIAKNIGAKIVLELANGPTTAAADDVLRSRNIILVPDILANAGGVTVSCFEWEQNLKNEHWSKEKVLTMLKEKMEKSFDEVVSRAERYDVDLRTAAYVLSLERLSVPAPTPTTVSSPLLRP